MLRRFALTLVYSSRILYSNMYVVQRSFKCFGKCFNPGDIIANVTEVKHFKEKLVDRKIIEVTEQNYDTMVAYFKQKFGVDISVKSTEVTDNKVANTAAKSTDANVLNAKPAAKAPASQPAKVAAAKVSK